MVSIFTQIIRGEIPCYKVAEDENYMAFLDINPIKKGHTLVVPKKEVDYIFDLDDRTLSGLHLFAKKVAIAIKKTIPCQRIGLSVIGLEVPHAHIHLIPMDDIDDILFSNPKLKMTTKELEKISIDIQNNW